MAKDYAKYVNAPRKPKKASGAHPLIVIAIGLFLLAAGYGFYVVKIKPNNTENKSLFAAIKTFLHHKKEVTPPKEKILTAIKTEPEIQFDFYNQLPNMQVHVPAQQTTTPSIPSGYVLQLGIYNSLDQASQARISYLLAGADANIVKLANGFRVQQGPYSSETNAKKIQKKLQGKGIETVLKKNEK